MIKETDMRLLIAVDMEGISGVVSLEHTNPEHHEYQRFRRIMTQDVNAAIRGAAEAGAEEIVVTDGHWNNTNILIEELDVRARLNSGSPSPFSMVQGVDQGIDAAMFIGYHARMGTAYAILDHTWSSARIANLWLNGRICGETGLNASVCGAFGVPVLMISGDQAVCAEASEWIAGITTVQVKRATGRHSAECLPVIEAQRRIQDGAAQAVRGFQAGRAPAPLQISTPVTVGIEFIYSDMADKAALYPGSARDGRRVDFSAADMPSAYRAFRAAITLAQR
jgi:D-amino peptidase